MLQCMLDGGSAVSQAARVVLVFLRYSQNALRRSQTWDFGGSRSRNAGSNLAAGMDVCLVIVLSVRGLIVGLITRPGESYRV